MKYRVKQTAKDQFIPQVKTNIFSSWGGIKYYGYILEPFVVFFYHPEFAIVNTLKEACRVIEIYKEHKLDKTKYPIYHNENTIK